jgi:hypothetical protein
MTDIRAELEAKWNEARLAGRADHEWRGIALAVEAPIRLLAGIREPDDRIALLLEAPISAAPRDRLLLQADGVSLADHRRSDEDTYRLALTLEDEGLRDIFEVLVADIVDVVGQTATPADAIIEAATRLEAWQACLRSRKRGLSKEELTGLIGELVVLRFLANAIGYPKAIESWDGPLDAIHDFKRLGLGVEVKSSIGPSHVIRISRLDQLETQGLAALLLARVRFRQDPQGMSLPDWVASIRAELRSTSPNSFSAFDRKLMRAGYVDADADSYSSTRVILEDLHGLEISEGFPRLTATTVPAAVLEASYALDERLLARFRLSEESFAASLGRLGGE